MYCGTVGALLLRDDGGAGLVRFRVEPCNRKSRETGYVDLAMVMQEQNSGLERPQKKPLQNLDGCDRERGYGFAGSAGNT